MRTPVLSTHWWMGAGLVCLCLMVIGARQDLLAQPRWDFTRVTTPTADPEGSKHHAQVALDAYGNSHMVWGDKDPNSAGLQLYYTNDATGRFTTPILATDTGTVFDLSLAARSSFAFRLDASGAAHLAFLANVDNRLRLFYTNNKSNRFSPAIQVADLVKYDMAVDSSGMAHIVWVSAENGIIGLYYWRSDWKDTDAMLLETMPCNSARFGCSVGFPEIEAGHRLEQGLTVAFRADSSSIYLTQIPTPPSFGLTLLPTKRYDPAGTRNGFADLRLRMALDTFGGVHLLAPIYSGNVHEMLYVSNAESRFQVRTLQKLQSAPTDFDLASNGGDTLTATWTTGSLNQPPPVVSVTELRRTSPGVWREQALQKQINAGVTGNGIKIAARGKDIVISGLTNTGPNTVTQVGLFRRQMLTPRIAYLHPDAAAAGMNVVVESIAPYREKGSFGVDGFHGETVRMELYDPADTARVIIGPSVVSWDGRVVSTMLFIHADARPGSIPVRINVNGVRSNWDTFQIVTPVSGRYTRGGVIGVGQRSRRGVLVVDSLQLSGGIFTVDTSDTDPTLPGNQGLLPVTILSLGPVRIDSSATLSLSGTVEIPGTTQGGGAPGGGSGGSGGWIGAGPGFTGGGGMGHKVQPHDVLGPSRGSGGNTSGRWMGGPALNGAPGGAVFPEAAAGGGTGHPFGASGTFGRSSLDEPTDIDGGGYGGGSAGYNAYEPRGTSGGGGGGFGSAGASGNPGDLRSNGGHEVGAAQLVPLAGGSGGGGGGYSALGSVVSGGAGGGAISLISYSSVRIDGAIAADGARGLDGKFTGTSGGGGGSGGGIILAAKGGIVLGEKARVTARGGAGGKGFSGIEHKGGNGGDGRIRIDGGGGVSFTQVTPSAGYMGPATISSQAIRGRNGELVQGYGEPGSLIRLFIRPAGGKWNYSTPIDTVVGPDGKWAVRLRGDLGNGTINIVAMQRVADPSRDEFGYEPAWVMSPAGGNAVGLPRIKLDRTPRQLPCINFSDSSFIDYEISNPGSLAALTITNARISGPDKDYFRVDRSTLQIPPGKTGTFRITFDPTAPRTFDAIFVFNSDAAEEPEAQVSIAACALSGALSTDSTLSLGSLCAGGSVDTTILLRNSGNDTLRVTAVKSSNEVYLDAYTLGRLPKVIPPGGIDSVRLMLTAKRFDPAGVDITFLTDAFVPVQTTRVYATNGQPLPEMPSALSFAPVDLRNGVLCSEGEVMISNTSATESLVLRKIILSDPRFSIVHAPDADTVLAPGGSLLLRLRFCPGEDGEFSGELPLSFFGGSCTSDATITLSGATVLSPEVTLESPATRTIEFAPVLPNTATPARTIVIRNRGTSSSALDAPKIEVYGDTRESEINVVVTDGDYLLEPGDSLKLSVTMTPDGVGPRSALIRFTATDDSWFDSVAISGEGAARAGVAVTSDTLDFGAVRVGKTAERDLVVSNIGAPVMIRSLGIDNPAFTDQSGLLPETLDDSRPEGRYRIVFQPTTTGEFFAELTVENSSSTAPKKYLRGIGILESISVDPMSVAFGCRPAGQDSTIMVSVRNGGTAPLEISGLTVASADNAFAVAPLSGVEIIPVGSSRSYAVTYRPGAAQSNGILTIVNSTGTNVDVPLSGSVCLTQSTISLTIPDREEEIGATFMLPILVDLGTTYDRDVNYELTLIYAPGLLRPLVETHPDKRPPLTEGTISTSVGMREEHLGQLIIRGTIGAGRRSDTLVGIPMRVLLSNVNTTVIGFSDVRFEFAVKSGDPDPTPGLLKSGVLTAVDCDTTRRIITGVGYKLSQNYPNPTSPATVIAYQVAFTERTVINLYDATGTFIRVLVDQIHVPGGYELRLDASDLGSGVYTYEMISGPFRQTRRMIVVE